MKWESLRGSSPVFYFEHAAEAESSVSVINEFVSFSLVWRMKKWFSFVMVLICVWSPIVLSVSRALIKYRSSFCVFSVSFRFNRRNGISICRGEMVNVCWTNKRRQIELGVSGGWILCGVEIYVWKYNRDIDILWVCWWHAGLRQTMALMISSKRVHQSVLLLLRVQRVRDNWRLWRGYVPGYQQSVIIIVRWLIRGWLDWMYWLIGLKLLWVFSGVSRPRV